MNPLQILHIEDSKDDSELIKQLLVNHDIPCELKRIETRPELFDALQGEPFDLILADCKLPNFSGLQALEIAHALKPETPFVFVSGTIGEETAIESLRNGATDYVLKDRLSRLVPAVRRALAEANERDLCLKMQRRLREVGRLEAISTLSNGIAHDFNNILTIILGHASLLAAEHNRPDRVLKLTETITEAAERAAEIVQQLMAFSRKSDGHMESTDLNRYLQNHLSWLREKIPPEVAVSFVPEADLPSVPADANQLERMLNNLTTNCMDAMPGGGRITISTKVVTSADYPNLLPNLVDEKYVCLKIADTGVGMDSVTRDHVFEPFYTTKERRHATGLGLPVVYGLMQAHGGYVGIDSEPDKGTTVSLFFPVPQVPSRKTPEVIQGTHPSLHGSETLLVVEDEPDVCFFLETILDSQGYTVLSAQDAAEAEKLFVANRDNIRLVLSDVGLPKVDGIEMCMKLKRLKPDLLVVLASGYSPKDFKDRMDQLDPNAFLPKPYNTHTILQTVRTALDAHKVSSIL